VFVQLENVNRLASDKIFLDATYFKMVAPMKLLIWDFDGTLAYRQGRWSGALLDVLNQYVPDHMITREQLLPHLRQGFPWHTPQQPHTHLSSADAWWAQLMPIFRAAFRANGIGSEQVDALATHVRAAYCQPSAWSTYPETIASLTALAEDGWTHVILSNHVPELPDLVRQLGLGGLVNEIFSSARTGYEKPHPMAFEYVLNRMMAVEQVWMVGDNPDVDISGAASLGISGILVRNSDPKAAYCCEDLTPMRAFLSQTDVKAEK
jgi:putative hydrolase of the HAD superfamily